MRRFLEGREWLAVALWAAVLLFSRMWEGDLHGDPLRYACVAKTMVETGDWIHTQLQPGMPYGNKPPLMFWLTALNFKFLGIGTYTAKFWSGVMAFMACVTTCLLGRRLFGREAGLLAGFMLACLPGIVPNATDLRLDSSVMFYTVLAVYGTVRAVQDKKPAWLLLAGVGGGLGMMTKQVAILHVLLLSSAALVLWRPRWLAHPYFIGAVLLAGLIGVPWHAHMHFHESSFTRTYFEEQIGGRLTPGLHMFKNLGLNILAMVTRGLPWWPLGLVAFARRKSLSGDGRLGMSLVLFWICETIILMAVPAKRYDRYIIPMYPALTMLAGYGAATLLSARVRELLPRWITGLALAAGTGLALLPVQIHTNSYTGCRKFRVLINAIAPGKDMALYDPDSSPQNVNNNNWGSRSAIFFYLNRTAVYYTEASTLRGTFPPAVVARDKYIADLAPMGYEVLGRFDSGRQVFWRHERRAAPFPAPPP